MPFGSPPAGTNTRREAGASSNASERWHSRCALARSASSRACLPTFTQAAPYSAKVNTRPSGNSCCISSARCSSPSPKNASWARAKRGTRAESIRSLAISADASPTAPHPSASSAATLVRLNLARRGSLDSRCMNHLYEPSLATCKRRLGRATRAAEPARAPRGSEVPLVAAHFLARRVERAGGLRSAEEIDVDATDLIGAEFDVASAEARILRGRLLSVDQRAQVPCDRLCCTFRKDARFGNTRGREISDCIHAGKLGLERAWVDRHPAVFGHAGRDHDVWGAVFGDAQELIARQLPVSVEQYELASSVDRKHARTRHERDVALRECSQ